MAKENLIDEKTVLNKLFFLQGDGVKVENKKIGIFYSAGSTAGNETGVYNLAKSVKAGVINKGYTPVMIPVKTTHPLYLYVNHNENYAPIEIKSIISAVEVNQSLHNFDGFVFVPMGEYAINAFLQVAIKLNLPSLFVGTGANMPSVVNGRTFTQGTIFSLVAEHELNIIDDKKFKRELDSYMPSLSEGEGLTYGNALNIALEVLSIALPGNGTILADSAERYNLAFRTGETICDLVEDQLVARKLLTKANFLNAISVLLALGFNSHPIEILLERSSECANTISLAALSDLNNKTPLLASLYPNGAHYISDLNLAGGVKAVLKSLSNAGVFNTRGTNHKAELIESEINKALITNELVIHDAKTSPILPNKPLSIVSGNLAEQNGFLNRAAIFRNLNGFSGYARVFDSEEDACRSVYAGRIKKGDLIVVKNQGNTPVPGQLTINEIQAAVNAAGLEKDVAIITDGIASPYFANIIVSGIKKATGSGEGIALVYEDDIIDIDIEDSRLNAKITAKDLSTRRRNFMPARNRDDVKDYEKYLK